MAHRPSIPAKIPVPIPSIPFVAAPLGLAEALVDGPTPVMVEAVPTLDDTDIDGPVWIEQFIKGHVAEDWTKTG